MDCAVESARLIRGSSLDAIDFFFLPAELGGVVLAAGVAAGCDVCCTLDFVFTCRGADCGDDLEVSVVGVEAAGTVDFFLL